MRYIPVVLLLVAIFASLLFSDASPLPIINNDSTIHANSPIRRVLNESFDTQLTEIPLTGFTTPLFPSMDKYSPLVMSLNTRYPGKPHAMDPCRFKVDIIGTDDKDIIDNSYKIRVIVNKNAASEYTSGPFWFKKNNDGTGFTSTVSCPSGIRFLDTLDPELRIEITMKFKYMPPSYLTNFKFEVTAEFASSTAHITIPAPTVYARFGQDVPDLTFRKLTVNEVEHRDLKSVTFERPEPTSGFTMTLQTHNVKFTRSSADCTLGGMPVTTNYIDDHSVKFALTDPSKKAQDGNITLKCKKKTLLIVDHPAEDRAYQRPTIISFVSNDTPDNGVIIETEMKGSNSDFPWAIVVIVVVIVLFITIAVLIHCCCYCLCCPWWCRRLTRRGRRSHLDPVNLMVGGDTFN